MHPPSGLVASTGAAATFATVTGAAVLLGAPRVVGAALLAVAVWFWAVRSRPISPLIPAWALVAYVVIEEQSGAAAGPASHHELLFAAGLVALWVAAVGGRRAATPRPTDDRHRSDDGSGHARNTVQMSRS